MNKTSKQKKEPKQETKKLTLESMSRARLRYAIRAVLHFKERIETMNDMVDYFIPKIEQGNCGFITLDSDQVSNVLEDVGLNAAVGKVMAATFKKEDTSPEWHERTLRSLDSLIAEVAAEELNMKLAPTALGLSSLCVKFHALRDKYCYMREMLYPDSEDVEG